MNARRITLAMLLALPLTLGGAACSDSDSNGGDADVDADTDADADAAIDTDADTGTDTENCVPPDVGCQAGFRDTMFQASHFACLEAGPAGTNEGCDPVLQNDCPEGQAGYFMDPDFGTTDCWPEGALTEGEDCSDMSLCASGWTASSSRTRIHSSTTAAHSATPRTSAHPHTSVPPPPPPWPR